MSFTARELRNIAHEIQFMGGDCDDELQELIDNANDSVRDLAKALEEGQEQ